VTVDVAGLLGVDHLFLLVNKALSKYDPKQIQEDVQEAFDTEVVGVLPLNEEMVELGSSDIFSLAFPKHAWSKGITGVADAILKIE
jgi:CO dehydrogenase nickel-insertion accessory protein CooC1